MSLRERLTRLVSPPTASAPDRSGGRRGRQRERYAKAQRLIRRGQPGRAAAVLRQQLDVAPRAAQTVYLYGAALALDGQLREAAPVLDRAYELKPWVRELDPTVADLRPCAEALLEIQPRSGWARYELARTRWSSAGLTLEWAVKEGLANSDTTLVQIGANDGRTDDPVHPYIRRHGWRGILLEPLPASFRRLQETYAGHDQLTLVNAAVVANDGPVQMYRDPRRPDSYAALDPDRNDLRRSDGLEAVEVRGISFATLFAEQPLDRVDLLQLDTEGADLEVLELFPFGRYHPTVVNLELNLLPLEERLRVFELLAAEGYAWRFRFDSRDLLAVDLDTYRAPMCLVDREAKVSEQRWTTDPGHP